MSDILDRAQALEELQRDQALERQRAFAAGDAGAGDGDCEMCREPIPPARLRALPNARCCVHCQSIADQRRRTAFGGR